MTVMGRQLNPYPDQAWTVEPGATVSPSLQTTTDEAGAVIK